jgi:hypothetical protein
VVAPITIRSMVAKLPRAGPSNAKDIIEMLGECTAGFEEYQTQFFELFRCV